MNSIFNTHISQPQQYDTRSLYGSNDANKMGMGMQTESLFSMALYDLDNQQHHMQQQPRVDTVRKQGGSAAFHPVDDYKDMSLRELLDLSDDFLFGDAEEQAAPAMNPIPVTVPSVQPVPSFNTQDGMMTMGQLDFALEPNHVIPPSNNKKRRRHGDDDVDSDLNQEGRFRPYQAGQWAERFSDLCEYRQKMGNCLVPHTFKENLPLARWVKRQRYQYKLMQEGKPSTMTEDRVRALEEIGFVWDSQGAAWGERLDELRDFRKVFMHCNVPSNYSENPQLATWVKCQRRQYKLFCEGKPSNMTPERIEQLEGIGFEWLLRSYKKARTN